MHHTELPAAPAGSTGIIGVVVPGFLVVFPFFGDPEEIRACRWIGCGSDTTLPILVRLTGGDWAELELSYMRRGVASVKKGGVLMWEGATENLVNAEVFRVKWEHFQP
ncbi:MAG: hypothetical protein KC897_11210 [Candidatus Omnitrophica bacterium]|nr:hypothetical protein [Candidatus Omnitrophota bacterium]